MSKAIDEGEDTASSIIVGRIPLLQIPEKKEQKPKNPGAVEAYILAYYYSALTNLLCQAYFSSAQETESDDEIQSIIRTSHADFQMLGIRIEACGQDEISASADADLYEQIQSTWRQQVRE